MIVGKCKVVKVFTLKLVIVEQEARESVKVASDQGIYSPGDNHYKCEHDVSLKIETK